MFVSEPDRRFSCKRVVLCSVFVDSGAGKAETFRFSNNSAAQFTRGFCIEKSCSRSAHSRPTIHVDDHYCGDTNFPETLNGTTDELHWSDVRTVRTFAMSTDRHASAKHLPDRMVVWDLGI